MGDDSDASPKLIRELGLTDATMIVMGSMIGSGIFITSAESARQVGSPGWLLVAWALAGVMTITGALCCAELAAMMPRAGGQYVFLREAYGPLAGFLFGWAMFLLVQTGTIAAVSVAFAKFFGVFAPGIAADEYVISPIMLGGYGLSLSTQQLMALTLIAMLTLTNMQGLKTGTLIQNSILTVTKPRADWPDRGRSDAGGFRSRKAAAFQSSWWHPELNGWAPSEAPVRPGFERQGDAHAFAGQSDVIGPLFSQSAWNNVTFTGGETRDPGRTLPLALLIGCGSVVVLYLLANVAYVVSLPLFAIQHAPQDRVGISLMLAALGDRGAQAMTVAILVSTFGCVNGLILAAIRN